jgi:hypothetical protein
MAYNFIYIYYFFLSRPRNDTEYLYKVYEVNAHTPFVVIICLAQITIHCVHVSTRRGKKYQVL